jgi:general secretion pathway protein I
LSTAQRNIRGFTLLEVLVALVLMGVTVTIIMQLFSANLRSLAASEEYTAAVVRAETKMREVLDSGSFVEGETHEEDPEGFAYDVSIKEALPDRAEDLNVRLMEIRLTLRWRMGSRDKSLTLTSLKLIEREV